MRFSISICSSDDAIYFAMYWSSISFLTLLTPLGIVTGLIILGVALKIHANGGNMNKGIGDSMVSLALDFA